jgi:hypothetical protein
MTQRRKRIELDDAQARASATEEFLIQLHRTTELLRANRHEDARRTLADAFEAQADDPSGQASLALVYFKLGLYPRALSLYRRLVEEYPADPVLSLNLSLVLFKTGQTAEARDVLERVVTLAPEYRKAYGYLGLAHQRLGDYRRAYEAFKSAGADHMAERMNRFVEADDDVGAGPEGRQEEEFPSIPPPEDDRHAALARSPSIPPVLFTIPLSGPQGGRPGAAEPLPVDELVDEARLRAPLAGRFLVTPSGYLVVEVSGRVFSRLEGLHFCAGGNLVYRPLKRRQRGADGDEALAGTDASVCEIEGTGRLGFHPGGGEFQSIALTGEVAYIREEHLFAFDPDLEYENGQISEGDISLVHLRGRGSLVFKSPSRLHALEVTPDAAVVIPAAALIGWFGRLIPRAARGGPFAPSLNALELAGEGVLLFCLE